MKRSPSGGMRPVALSALCILASGCGSPPATPASPVIAIVGGASITQHQFDLRLASATAAVAQGGAPSATGTSDAMTASIRATVLKSLVIDAVVAEAAQAAHIAAGEREVDAEVASDQRSAGGADALATQLAEAGGSMDQLRDEIRSRINEQRLEDLLAKQRAADALSALGTGTPFATVARQYSDDDTSSGKGGDMGMMTLGQLQAGSKAFLDAALALLPGHTVTTPVRDPSGYEILRVDTASAAGRALHRVLVAAPDPYTVRERPPWFTETVLSRLEAYCNQGQVHLMLGGAAPICVPAASPSG